ncbi:MAG: hypothetical protein M3112_08675 [Actinomycetia bacterium]|nr:hypothetical protein [Actinomycetes bacterium]
MSEPTTEEVPWKIPVSAAILGALLTAIYVIFTIVNAPTEDPDAVAESGTLPSGHVAVMNNVGMRADVLRSSSEGTTVFVSSVVSGGTDPGTTSPVAVATWELASTGGNVSMIGQSLASATPAAVTIDFPPVQDGGSSTLTATLPGKIEEADDVLTISAGLPTAVVDHRITVGDHVVVVDELVIDEQGGWMQWHLESGVAAKLDVVVSIDGLAFAVSGDGSDAEPAWNQRRVMQLLRVGTAPPESDSPFNITVELYPAVVTAPGDSIEIPIGSVAGP